MKAIQQPWFQTQRIRDDLNDSVVDEYISSMEKLLQLKTDEVRPGHYRSFDRRRLRQLVRQYIEAKKAPLCPAEK